MFDKFDLSWFTTIPGVLIICGVVLLLIAIILFILGNKKAKKEGTEVQNDSFEAMDTTNETVSIEEPTVAVEPVVEQPSIAEVPVTEPTVEQPVEPVVEQPSVTVEPVIEPVVSETIKIEEPIVISEPEVEPTVNSFEIPVITPIEIPEEPVQVQPTIYGGNDPLEKTQNIRTVEENHVPYGASEIKIVEPTSEVVTENNTNTNVEIPSMSINNEVQPTIIETPTPVNIEVGTTEENSNIEEL